MNRRIQILFGLLLFSLILNAQDEKGLLESANTAYENKSYAESIMQYQKVIDFGYQSLAVYNNIGSSFFKIGI